MKKSPVGLSVFRRPDGEHGYIEFGTVTSATYRTSNSVHSVKTDLTMPTWIKPNMFVAYFTRDGTLVSKFVHGEFEIL